MDCITTNNWIIKLISATQACLVSECKCNKAACLRKHGISEVLQSSSSHSWTWIMALASYTKDLMYKPLGQRLQGDLAKVLPPSRPRILPCCQTPAYCTAAQLLSEPGHAGLGSDPPSAEEGRIQKNYFIDWHRIQRHQSPTLKFTFNMTTKIV